MKNEIINCLLLLIAQPIFFKYLEQKVIYMKFYALELFLFTAIKKCQIYFCDI